MGGRSAAALVVIPHEEADDAGKDDDGAQKEGEHHIAAAAAVGGVDFRGHEYLLVRFMNAWRGAWFIPAAVAIVARKRVRLARDTLRGI